LSAEDEKDFRPLQTHLKGDIRPTMGPQQYLFAILTSMQFFQVYMTDTIIELKLIWGVQVLSWSQHTLVFPTLHYLSLFEWHLCVKTTSATRKTHLWSTGDWIAYFGV